MNTFPEEGNLKSIISSQKAVASVEYITSGKAIQAIFERMKAQLQRGEGSVIVVPDKSMFQEISNQLLSSLFGNVSLVCEMNATVKATHIQQIQKRIQAIESKRQPQPVISSNGRILVGPLAEKWHQVRTEKDDDDLSIGDWLNAYLQQPEEPGMFVMQAEYGQHPFTFYQGEFKDWLEIIRKAATLYRPEFSQTTDQNSLAGLRIIPGFFDQMEDISHHLFVLKEQAADLRDQYYRYIHSLEAQFCNEYEKRLGVLESNLETVKMLFYLHPKQEQSPSTDFLSYQAAWNQIEKEMMGLRLIEKFSATQGNLPPVAQVEAYLDLVHNRRGEIGKLANTYIKSLNLLNQEDEELILLESSAHQLINYLNKTKLFTETFEINTISLQKQAAYFRYIAASIDGILHLFFHNRALLEWQFFIQQLPGEQLRFIDIACSLDKDSWEQVFRSWYGYCRISEGMHRAHPVSEQDWVQAEKTDLESFLPQLQRQLASLWREVSAQTKDYQQFVAFLRGGNEGEFPLTWADFLSHHASCIRALFPIVLIDDDQLPEWSTTAFHHLVYVDCSLPNVEILQYFRTIFSWYAEGSLAAVPDFVLTDTCDSVQKQISTLSRSEKLPFFRLVTEKLLSFGASPVAFGIRNGCIVSFCSEGVHSVLMTSLRQAGIKKIASMATDEENLLGALLNSGEKIYIIVEDGLPNGTAADMWEYQRQQLAWLQECGFTVVHVCLKSAFRTHGKSVASFFMTLVDSMEDEDIPSVSQLQFAFD